LCEIEVFNPIKNNSLADRYLKSKAAVGNPYTTITFFHKKVDY